MSIYRSFDFSVEMGYLTVQLVLLLVMVVAVQCSANYYVTPSESSSLCPLSSLPVVCLTLEQYAQNNTYFTSGAATFHFLDGTHNLSSSIAVVGSLEPLHLIASGKATIRCTRSESLSFTNASNVTVEGLEIVGCGSKSRPALQFDSVLSLRLTALTVQDSQSRAVELTLHNEATAVIRGCSIHGSMGGALAVRALGSNNLSSFVVIVDNSTISGNSLSGGDMAKVGSAILIKPENHNLRHTQAAIIVRDTVFENNVNHHTQGEGQSTVYLADMTNVSFSNCKFSSNRGTPITAVRSVVSLSGVMEFVNNTGYQGGGLALYGNSLINIEHRNTVMNFTSNQANNVGGGLFIQSLTNNCFFRVLDGARPNITFIFNGNKAMNGGNAIYGLTSTKTCAEDITSAVNGGRASGHRTVFHFEPDSSSDISVISSDPLRVCVCENSVPNCSHVLISRDAVPGKAISIPLVAVGGTLGAASGPVHANLLEKSHNHTLIIGNDGREHLTSASQCTNINYTISSSADSALLALTTEDITAPFIDSETVEHAVRDYMNSGLADWVLLTVPLYVNVSFLDCPISTVFDASTNACICDPVLMDSDIQCNIPEETLTLPGDLWVSIPPLSGSAGVIITVQHCLLGYCFQEPLTVPLSDPDDQCVHNRSGTLCGGCRVGQSLTLGTPICHTCSNSYLLLLFLFAINGLLLVLFLRCINLTVDRGTINGLLFYANIVWINRSLFFTNSQDTSFVLVFIAWLNLDLGYITCFYDGLDMYAFTWLQYAFPLYLCSLAFMILILGHCSKKMNKMLRNNSLSVLATVLLLTYTKISRNIINSLLFTRVTLADGSSKFVWTLDGNIEYLGGQHIYLFIAAIIVLVSAWLPFTAVVLFGQCLPKLSQNELCRWFNTFLNAYYTPLRSSKRFWVGLLLLLRCVVLSISALNPLNREAISLLVTFITAVLLLYLLTRWGTVYKNKYIGQLETLFLLNLATLAGVQMYVMIAGGGRLAAIQTSVFIVLAKFLLILLCHTYTSARRKFKIIQTFEKKCLPKKMIGINRHSTAGKITLSDSLTIESMYSTDNPDIPHSVRNKRFLSSRSNSRWPHPQRLRSRIAGHSNTGLPVALGNAMETTLSQVSPNDVIILRNWFIHRFRSLCWTILARPQENKHI